MLPYPYQRFKEKLSKQIDLKRILDSPLQTIAYGTDASFYRLVPKIVVLVRNEDEVISTIKIANELDLALTFRAAGTSLSGQAISDSILVVATHGWRNLQLLENNNKIKLEPGIVGAKVNNYLAPYGLKIGPDPASIGAAMIGGIVANNASGMCCGTSQNSYKTVTDLRIVLSDGSILDTSDQASVQAFYKNQSRIIDEISLLRDSIANDPILFQLIKNKFKIKNTTGYSINAFVDYHDPIEIIKHLMIGSEGTLAFISNVTLKTVVDEKHKACSLIFFNSIQDACNATILLKETPVSAVELLDRDSVRSVENDPKSPAYFKKLPDTACALLVECRDNDLDGLKSKQEIVQKKLGGISTCVDYEFTTDSKEYYFIWKIRKGLLPTVGGLRKTGTSVIIEDVAFPLAQLADGCVALKKLFKKYAYHDAVLFGHALEGNLHFVFSQDFSNQTEVDRYESLMHELAHIVVGQFNGSLKAEHGTGRNMAPFVEQEWGSTAYEIMKRIKNIFDPKNKINPDVLINPDPKAHIKNLKLIEESHAIVDKCIECGFCEPNCVSEGLTLSPRQRIVVAREISRLEKTGETPELLEAIKKDVKYQLDETCATDGLCALACPVDIDTGKFVKSWRSSQNSPLSNKIANSVGVNMAKVTAIMRVGLSTINFFHTLLGTKVLKLISAGVHFVSFKKIPIWVPQMPKGAKKRITN